MSTADIAQQLYLHLKKIVANKKVDANSILNVTLSAMLFVESYKTVTGEQKKEMVLQAIERVVNEIPNLEPETRANLNLVMKLTLPGFIDNIIKVNNGELSVINNECMKKCSCNLM